MMETLSTFEIDKFFNSENKKKTFQEKNAITNFFTNSTNSIINNSNLKLQILQDIKRRDEIRELYNTYKHRELRKNIYIEKYESSTIRLVDNINNKTLTENDFNESEYKDETKIINETKNYNDKNNDDIININSYKISGRMKSNEPMPLHELNNIQYKPIL
ncbi:hypothetical protein BCR36DRAFT_113773 [Piromyces finnis]|uniref:Uncharacterized protein n=1 Tax=Piromyces finnis TaxID=1754191 RepID=A0A1Y1VKC5_9FUNG|nr:hypothetical protein BCR36DRAFT_113773 [Piromyces finnis]|eukprot:ORX58533.1 hypothetical protein BCR36DRAFT_113773 [Piromyces finnis]